jgi:uncharacterized protein
MEHKTFSLGEFKALGSKDEAGSFEALVAVFGNVDAGGDRVQRGAFKRSLGEWHAKGRSVPVLWSHDPESVPIGVITEAGENAEGLRVKAKLLVDDHPQARAVYAAMKAGALHEFSFGYSPRDYSHVTENGQKIRVLKDVDLAEISPVFRGMNPATRLMGVKSDLQTRRDEIEAKIADLDEQRKALTEAIDSVTEVPEDAPPEVPAPEEESGNQQEPDDNPEPNPVDEAGEEAMARIRALQAVKPMHLE